MDLTHFMNGRAMFTQPQPQAQAQDLQYDMVQQMVGGGGGMLFRSDSTAGTGSTTASLSAGGGFEIETGGGSGNGRWPRQETLTLLEVRSRLDSKFKEANQKGPLWDEVSRIMCEEHGYQRTGKKCREKFENLYKYYKKTKEGKAGRQDGKHYRFFRQLEALYGETSVSHVNPNPNPNPSSFSGARNPNIVDTSDHIQLPNDHTYQVAIKSPSHDLSNNSSAFDTSSSGYSDCMDNKSINKRALGKRGWKTKIKDFIDAQMRKIMEKQEEWMEKMMKSIEQKEQERVLREEQWRNEEVARFEKEHKLWENERAWMESRDSALMEALHKLTAKESYQDHNKLSPNDQSLTNWGENEITRLIQIRTSMESRFEQNGFMDAFLWEEVASKMACLGYTRNGVVCKTKWDSINEFLTRTKKRKENARIENSYESLSHMFHHQVGNFRQVNDGLVAHNSQPTDGSYRFLMGEHNMWDGYGMKQSKDEDH